MDLSRFLISIVPIGVVFLILYFFVLDPRFMWCIKKKDYFTFRRLMELFPNYNCSFDDERKDLYPWDKIIETCDTETANKFFEIGLSAASEKMIDRSILKFAVEHDFQFSPEVMELCSEYMKNNGTSEIGQVVEEANTVCVRTEGNGITSEVQVNTGGTKIWIEQQVSL